MEGLQTEEEIDEEIVENIEAFREHLGIESTFQIIVILKAFRLTSTQPNTFVLPMEPSEQGCASDLRPRYTNPTS